MEESIVVRMSTVKNSMLIMPEPYATVARTMPGPPLAFIVMAKLSFVELLTLPGMRKSHVPMNSSDAEEREES